MVGRVGGSAKSIYLLYSGAQYSMTPPPEIDGHDENAYLLSYQYKYDKYIQHIFEIKRYASKI